MIRLKVTNIKNVEAALKKYGEDAVKEIGAKTEIVADEIVNKAKSLAPVNKQKHGGDLQQSIRREELGSKLHQRAVTYNKYAPFQEFGTGGLVNIQKGWGEMARQFIGKGIKQVNIAPQPFMYPAFVFGRGVFSKEIKESLKHLNKKFNNG